MAKVIGIDLGTTNSCVAVLEGGHPIVIANSEGARTTPSVIGFTKDEERLIGQPAKRQGVTNAENTVYSIKRFIGRRWIETEGERASVPYTCVRGRDDTVDVQIRGQAYTPQQISAMVLQKLKQDAEAFLGEAVTQAVITVPAYFTDAQRHATKDAGQIAGLEVLRIINEPTAAALSYGLDKLDRDHKILVFDLGGGTFDVSVMQLGDGVFEVKSTAGNNHLGGDDFDWCIVRWLFDEFQLIEGIDLSADKLALQRVREAAERAKIELSNAPTTSINLPFITADETGPKNLEVELSRAKFEELAAPLIRGTIEPVAQALKDAGLVPERIDRIILVGGSTRIPAVQQAISQFFGGKVPDRSVNPDEAVALGAAIQAGVLGGEVQDLLLLDVAPLSLGIETLGGVMTKIIERNTTIPSARSQIFSTATDGQTTVEIHALQGERAMAEDNKSLGKFLLTGIPPAPRGLPQIEVSFEIDADGILQVEALDRGTGKQQSIRITSTGGLSPEEIEQMRRDADRFADEDQARRALADLRNQATQLFHSYESLLSHNRNLLDETSIAHLEDLAGHLRVSLDSPTPDATTIQAQFEALQGAVLAVGESAYRSNVPGVAAPAPAPTPVAPLPPPPPPVSSARPKFDTLASELSAVMAVVDGESALEQDETAIASADEMAAASRPTGGSGGLTPTMNPPEEVKGKYLADISLPLDSEDDDEDDDDEFDTSTIAADYEAIED